MVKLKTTLFSIHFCWVFTQYKNHHAILSNKKITLILASDE